MTNLNLDTRETKFTDAEFDAIARNADGRIIDDFPIASCFFTAAQVERLHGDDWSYYQDVQEELRIMAAEFV